MRRNKTRSLLFMETSVLLSSNEILQAPIGNYEKKHKPKFNIHKRLLTWWFNSAGLASSERASGLRCFRILPEGPKRWAYRRNSVGVLSEVKLVVRPGKT